ncbi:MAG: response regulator transcription factor [Burkholderiales bacterium]
MLRTILVEDSTVVRERLVELVQKIDGVEVVGEYENADGAIEGIRADKPHVVLLDIKLRGSSGLEVMKAINQDKIDTKVIVLTNYAEPQYQKLFLAQGALAVLDKSKEFNLIEGLLLSFLAEL